MTPGKATSWKLTEEQRRQMAIWMAEFEHTWNEGQLEPRVLKLPPPGHPLRLPALVELVKIDLRRHWLIGRPAHAEGYLSAYPELQTPDTLFLELIQVEQAVLQQVGKPMPWSEFADRYAKQLQRRRVAHHGGRTPEAKPPATPPSPTPGAPTAGSGPGGPTQLPERFGRYQVVRKLGAGGMGTVYLAQDTQLQRPVALKVPHFDEDDPKMLERFHREARAAATLHHPGVCPVFDVGQINGVHYMTMGYVEGTPLNDYVRDERLDDRRVAGLVQRLALVMDEAHSQGVIHRDLKPSNVMITHRRKEPVIVDFGMARRLNTGDVRLTNRGDVLGTPAYMAPEMLADAGPDGPGASCDIYSLAVILYELLCGRRPFQGHPTAIACQVLTENPPPPSAHRPDIDRRLEAVCMKAMARRVADRYATMGAFAAALEDYLRAPPPEPEPPAEEPEEVVPVVRSRWALWALAAAAAILTAVAVFLVALAVLGRS